MRTNTLFLILCLATSAVAQNWCPPGAVWTYRYDGWGADYREEYRYMLDTLYEGRSAQKVARTVEGLGFGGTTISGYSNEYTAREGDVVSIWSEQWNELGPPGWDTLYWFGAEVGERWWPPGHPRSCPPYGMLEVVATGETEVGGLFLQTLDLVTIDQDGFALTDPFQLVERIGMTPRTPFFFDCGVIIDYFFPYFICYSDDDIQVPEGADCFLSLGGSEEDLERSRPNLHPNPGSTFFQLTGLGQLPVELRLLDLQGRVVLVQNAWISESRVDVSMLPAGVYMVEVISHVGRQVLRWVKE